MGRPTVVSGEVHLRAFLQATWEALTDALSGDHERVVVVVWARSGWRWFSVPNMHAAPRTHFEVDPRCFWEAEARDEDVRLVIHSHPRGPRTLSAADLAMCRTPRGDALFPGVLWGVWAPVGGPDDAARVLSVYDYNGVPQWSLG